MHHPGLVPIRPNRGCQTPDAPGRDLLADPYSFQAESHKPANPDRKPLTSVTFDFWNTIYSANDGAMDKVRPQRSDAIRRLLARGGVHPAENEMLRAYRSGFDAYMAAWTGGRHFGAREQVAHFLHIFGLNPTLLGEEALAQTALDIENASLGADLKLLPGLVETVPALAATGYRLGIISDTSLTPGRILRKYLEKDGLLDCFSVLTFSDETGYPKPDRRMFENTLAKLAAAPTEAVHVGDTPRTDIAGAQTVGMLAIRCAGTVDHPEPPEADFVIRDHREIPRILESLG